ncbi:MAG: FAD-dependent oxidoreductase [Thiogranum sp.]
MRYDLVIIGAGIHGAAVAQAAAAAGYRTLVLEQYDQAATATSSKSSKLVHGGLRYLESGQISLVRECLRERRRLLKNAPHLVHLTPFHIPVYKDTQRRPWKIRLGLSLYTLLGGKAFRQVTKSGWHQLDGLRTNSLNTVLRYYDGQTDDVKLTLAVLSSAQSLGAEVKFECTFQRAACSHQRCCVFYREQGVDKEIRARALVNASGPWVNSILKRVEPAPETLAIDLVQGTHLVIPGTLQQGMYYLEAPQDQRAVFVMPWQDNILLGTTESLFSGDPSAVQPREEDIRYLLAVYNHYFENTLDRSQVMAAFAGLRVLPKSEEAAFNRSRDTLLHIDEANCPRVLSIYGGKLTSHRATAEQVIRRLRPLLPERKKLADTRTLSLPAIS